MKTNIFFVVALLLARVASAQTPSPAGQTGWQLGQGFDVKLPQSSSSPNTSAPATTSPVSGSTLRQDSGGQASTQPAHDRKSSGAAISYVEGSIWTLTFVKTKPGATEDYFKSISASLKPIYEEGKKQKLILDYKILSADSGDDFNVIIMVEYPNMAAVDGSRERIEPIVGKIIGPENARTNLATKRLDMRDILATKTMREIWLK